VTRHEPVPSVRLDRRSGLVLRRVAKPDGRGAETAFATNGVRNREQMPTTQPALSDVVDAAFLRNKRPPRATTHKWARVIRIADVFSGCGFMTLGVAEAARALGFKPRPVIAFDINEQALTVFSENFPGAITESRDVRSLWSGDTSAPLSRAEQQLKATIKRIDIAVAGPPCQGHSDLNNYTRRHDPKNALYYRRPVLPSSTIREGCPSKAPHY
jgi:DNA (cytosine-5)-methyltransferase 1